MKTTFLATLPTVECREMGDKTLQGDTTIQGGKQKTSTNITMRAILILLTLAGLIAASSYVYVKRDDLTLLTRAKRDVIEMSRLSSDTNHPVVSSDNAPNPAPNAASSSLEDRPVANSVLRHHAVKQEVNTHINLQDFMKAAAEKIKSKDQDKTDNDSSTGDSGSSEIVESELVQVEKLPDFDVCPIMPELPGEFGTIRKVREIERKNVQERVKGLIRSFFFLRRRESERCLQVNVFRKNIIIQRHRHRVHRRLPRRLSGGHLSIAGHGRMQTAAQLYTNTQSDQGPQSDWRRGRQARKYSTHGANVFLMA